MQRLAFASAVAGLVLLTPIASPAQSVVPTVPVQAAAPEPASAAVGESVPTSLFEPTSRQFEVGARWSSVAGDPARWQRYEDLRNGPLFTGARYERSAADGGWQFRAAADNVGWRDQRFLADYQRPGAFKVTTSWDQIPQFYSVDTQTPFTSSGRGVLVLDDGAQRAIQNGQATLGAYLPLAERFDLRERRDVGKIAVAVTPADHVDLQAAFTTTKHSGELPWGADFGFGNDVEVALPYDSRTNDLSLGAEWSNGRSMMRVGYDGSWFDNQSPTLIWDNPLQLDDAASAPGRGRTSLWPSNSAQTVSAAGFVKLPRRTQVSGVVSFGEWSNDQTLQPFTINAALPQLTLPRSTADAAAGIFSTSLTMVSRPMPDWRFSARLRRYDYDNQTAPAAIPQFINYDTAVATSATGGPEAFAHSVTNLDADATFSGVPFVALTAGYARNQNGYQFRIFEHTTENTVRLMADAVGSQWITFRAHYERARRTGSGLDEELLTEIGEQPLMRHYDLADRTRDRLTGQIDIVPSDLWTLSVSTGLGGDDYDDSYFGLQESRFRTATVALDFQRPDGWAAGGSYSFERYSGLQRSRSANPGDQQNDPLRDWTTDSRERVHYFSIYLHPPRIGRRTEARLSYDYAYSRGDYIYGIVAGGPLAAPSQLPEVFNKLQDLRIDVRHRLTERLAARLAYEYEPFDVFDFALDPSVVNSIVQPSSLVLGYVYRPYSAHSTVIGLMYFW